jgi:predicted component of type VI protein secretion system
MATPVIELALPLEGADDSQLATRRHRHLSTLPGVDEATTARLEGAFPTLHALYTASEDRLAAVVGSILAARIRWFLDGPLHTTVPAPAPPRARWRHAA